MGGYVEESTDGVSGFQRRNAGHVRGGLRMKSRLALGWAAELTILLACVETFAAEAPAAPSAAPTAASVPPTLWSFLGLKQCVDKCKKHIVLHKEKKAEKQALQGGHPCLKHLFGPRCPCGCLKCEILKKKPPVKPLADPGNLQSQNPAIKAAAEIKTEEDLAPQKVKAIRYLATIACGCYPQVKPALLAALDDCTEEVRYEAALAFCRSAGNPCSVCNSSTCCDPEVRKKLSDLAGGADDQGCWKEPSSRVRSAAAGAKRLRNGRSAGTRVASRRSAEGVAGAGDGSPRERPGDGGRRIRIAGAGRHRRRCARWNHKPD